jgi:hypothetical protein
MVGVMRGPLRLEATTGRRWGGRSGTDERGYSINARINAIVIRVYVLITAMPRYSPSMMGLLCAPVLARVLILTLTTAIGIPTHQWSVH